MLHSMVECGWLIMSAACTLTCLLVGAICVNLEESALPIKLISTLHRRGVELEVSAAVMAEVAWAGYSLWLQA